MHVISAIFLCMLSPVGSDKLTVLGKFHQHLHLGFSGRFSFDFCVVDLLYGILGADFLQRYHLLVNISATRLSETLDLEKCGMPNSEEFVIDDAFAPSSGGQSDKNVMTELQRNYSEVFLRSRVPKHFVEATVDTVTEEPMTVRCRRLSSEKYKALKVEIKRLCDQEILECSQSAWSLLIVMVKKKNGSYRMCADLTNLNKILEVQKYSLPNLKDFTSSGHGCQYFSSIDIRDA